eukprot:COSAG01_NODE_47716_length_387_cov_3.163194_1_plen_62_part_01
MLLDLVGIPTSTLTGTPLSLFDLSVQCTAVQGSAILLSRCAAAILQRALFIYQIQRSCRFVD